MLHERITYFGGPHDGEQYPLVIAVSEADGQRLSCSHGPEGFYVLTTYPTGMNGRGERRRVWIWWDRRPGTWAPA